MSPEALRETSVPLHAAKLERYGEVKELPPSSIVRILGTNCAPSDDQREEVRILLANPRAELEAVENNIGRLQARLSDLQKRKRELISYVDDLDALLSPIKRMPPEIMTRVFDFCGDFHAYGPHCEPSKRAPLVLGGVCRSWRALSLAMPRLWTALYLNLPTCGTFEKQEDILNAWLERSRPFPISLWLWNNFLTDDVPDAFLRTLSRVISDNSDRWKAIFIHFPAYTRDWQYFTALVRCQFPTLEQLEISPQCTPWAPFRPEFLPRLRELQIPAGAMPDSHKTLPWTQLTRLTLRGGYQTADIDTLLTILRCAPLLTHLHVEITQYKTEIGWDVAQPHISMPCLDTLVLVTITNHDDCISHFMDALVLPQLRDFQLHTRVWDHSRVSTTWSHQSFMSLLARSKCSLNQFTLIAVSITGTQLRQVMEKCPSLVLVKLNGPDVHLIMAAVLKDMVVDAQRENGLPLAPWLKALSLSCESSAALDYKIDDTGLTFEQAFARMVTSRTTQRDSSNKVLQLKWIHWTIWWEWSRVYLSPVRAHPDPQLEERLQRLCATELEVGVSAATYNRYKRVS